MLDASWCLLSRCLLGWSCNFWGHEIHLSLRLENATSLLFTLLSPLLFSLQLLSLLLLLLMFFLLFFSLLFKEV